MARAQGSGSAGWKVVVGVLVSLHCCSLLASSATFTVGGTQGWTIGPDYATWAAGQTFAPGDVLLFPYTKGAHNVVEVGKAGYDACSATNALATHTEGNTSVTLASAGAYYFVCSFPGHCTAGMLLAVTVGGGAIAPAPAPNATAPAPAPVAATTPPAPVPSPASVATPVPVPAPAFTPTPTPSSTPAPAPLAPAPASTSTPPSSPSASSPPAPSGTTPPSSAPSLSSSTFLAAVLLGLGGALLAL